MDWTVGANLLTGFATLAMVAVWMFYARMAFKQYRESRRPWFIVESAGPEKSTNCYLVNMSEQTAHVSALLAVVHAQGRQVARRIRSAQATSSEEESPQKSQLGPIASGSSLLIGTFDLLFEDLIASEVGWNDETSNLENIECLEIRVIAESIVDEDGPVGASRKFLLQQEQDSTLVVRLYDMTTQQLRSSAERETVRGWLWEMWEHDGMNGTWETRDRN